jgi:hypothetical protein
MQFSTIGRPFTRAVGLAVVAGLALVAALVFGASYANASPVAIFCIGTQAANYAPPLGPVLQNTTVSVLERLGTFSNGNGTCVGAVAGGHAEAVFMEQTSCLVPAPSRALVQNVLTYHWDNGARSTITFTATTVTHVGAQTIVTATGTVTDGFGEGAPASKQIVMPDLDVQQCLESSVEHQEGPMTLTIG